MDKTLQTSQEYQIRVRRSKCQLITNCYVDNDPHGGMHVAKDMDSKQHSYH